LKNQFHHNQDGTTSICDNREGHLMKWIANEIMNRNTTDKQIYTYLSRDGYHDKDMITKHINWVRKYRRF